MAMLRPCFLVIDREFPGSISTRKLVIETAKLNVITAYSAAEGLETLAKFPAVSGIVLDADISDMPHEVLVGLLKQSQPNVPIVVISPPGVSWSPLADYHLDFFDPVGLLALLKQIEPGDLSAIKAHEDDLAKDISKNSA